MNLTRRRQLVPLLLAVTLTPLMVWLFLWAGGVVGQDEPDQQPLFKLSDRLASLHPVEVDGQWHLRFRTPAGDPVDMDAQQFVQAVADRRVDTGAGRNLLFQVLDITGWTGLFWVGLGLFGQVLFAGRMIVQWLVSEKSKRSVVPNVFWWMSLGGASMLIIYFIWRVDIVGVLGQATGWFIYVRNIWLIYAHADEAPESTVTDPE